MNSLNQIITYDDFIEEIAAGGGGDNTPFEPLDIEFGSVSSVGTGKIPSRSPARKAIFLGLGESDDSAITPQDRAGDLDRARNSRGQHSLKVYRRPTSVSACAGSHFKLKQTIVAEQLQCFLDFLLCGKKYYSAPELPYKESATHDEEDEEEEEEEVLSGENPVVPGLFPTMNINDHQKFMTFDVLPLNPTHVE